MEYVKVKVWVNDFQNVEELNYFDTRENADAYIKRHEIIDDKYRYVMDSGSAFFDNNGQLSPA